MNQNETEKTSVLVVGGSLVGLSAAMFLAHRDVDVVVVERHEGSAKHPRATGFFCRTIELFRTVGLEVKQPNAPKGKRTLRKMRVESLAGDWFEEQFWVQPGTEAPPPDDFSPVHGIGIAQDRLEPQLRDRATELGAEIRMSHALVAFEENEDGVVATIRPSDGADYTVHADYMIAADGQRSPVRETLGITRTGIGYVRSVRSVLFRAPIDHYLDSGITQFTIDQPDFDAFLSTYLDGRWILMFSDDDVRDEATLREMIRRSIGRDDIEVEVITTGRWEVSGLVADLFATQRVFLAGDAAHTLPPNRGGYGANTGIDDVHNLAWKLAEVLAGRSTPDLLASYDPERRPVATLRHDQIFIRDDSFIRPEDGTVRQVDILEDAAMELGQLYRSEAVIGAGPELAPALRPDQWRGQPGTRAPHAWLTSDQGPKSTIDVLTRSWTLVSAEDSWAQAAEAAASATGIPVTHLQIGHDLVAADGTDLTDLFGLGPDMATLVRPDGYIAWRSPADYASRGQADALTHALAQVAAAARAPLTSAGAGTP